MCVPIFRVDNYYGNYFIHRQWRSKVNLVDNVDEDTITFQFKSSWYFDKKETEPLTGDEIIVVPHIMLLVSYKKVLFFFQLLDNNIIAKKEEC